MQLPEGPWPPPRPRDAHSHAALPSGSTLQGGSPEIDLLRIRATIISHSSPHAAKADVWHKSIHQKRVKRRPDTHLLSLGDERRRLAAREAVFQAIVTPSGSLTH